MVCSILASFSCARRNAVVSDLDDACGCWRQDPPWVFLAIDVEPSHDVDSLQSAVPAEAGTDAVLLEAGVTSLAEHKTLFSVLVLRDDKIVLERYFQHEDSSHAHNTQSVTKSILSALVGIAIDEGFIQSVDQTAADFLPALFSTVEDFRMLDITLRHLLTMTPGFAEEDPSKGLSLNLLSAAISSTLATEPGSTFDYNSISSHLVSAILTEATGMSTCAFACRYLLEPIGVTVDNWSRDAQGIYVGGAALYLTPRDLARFGLLYLNNGMWEDRQVVPSEWIAESTSWHASDSESPDWGYGYYWWLSRIEDHSAYVASGYGGQTIVIMPDLDLIIVTTGDSSVATQGIPVMSFVEGYVIPAIETSTAD